MTNREKLEQAYLEAVKTDIKTLTDEDFAYRYSNNRFINCNNCPAGKLCDEPNALSCDQLLLEYMKQN